jgi:hypothetical protein
MSLSFEDIFSTVANPISGQQNRWYDAYPDLQKALVILVSFPPEILDIVAEGIVHIAERDCKANEIIKSVKSIGKDKVLALHQSKARRRFYDNNPQLHKAMNYIFILSENKRQYVCRKMKNLIEYVFDYLKTCDDFKEVPTKDTIDSLATTFVNKGSPAALAFLNELQSNFENGKPISLSQQSNTNVLIGKKDMRIQSSE